MTTLYIEAFQDSEHEFLVNVETFVILFVYNLSDITNINLVMKINPKCSSKTSLVKIHASSVNYEITSHVSELATYCKWPCIVKTNEVIAGVSSVARQLIKSSSSKEVRNLLGFRQACLMACAETSVWTRFCEINMITMAKNVLQNLYENQDVLNIPQEISRYEYHMAQPVKMHNIYNIARQQNTRLLIDTKMPVDKLNLHHDFSEGVYMTLADAILYCTFTIFFHKYSLEIIKEKFPLTMRWYEKIDHMFKDKLSFKIDSTESQITKVGLEEFSKKSLYVGDVPSHRTEKGMFTKQADVENALKMLKPLENNIINEYSLCFDTPFSWDKIPLEANPNGGSLPQKRANRKCEQLENLVKVVQHLVKNKKYKIVDFCSGSGHLGILLAVILPNCHIILVENKERSLERALNTISLIKLANVSVVQSNLDYFKGDFDIGVALHACGVATDLVLKTCIEMKAHFVCCPCCYGGIKNCHQVTYPLSKQFKNLNIEDKFYFILAHAADQTHDVDNVKTKQGFLCMDVIDTDRRLYTESFGYVVHLAKLQPVTCTNKNNLLIGSCKEKY